MALAVFTEVLASLWPLDPTPRLLNRLLLEYEFAAATGGNEHDRCRQVQLQKGKIEGEGGGEEGGGGMEIN